jgi:hypothetical protein
MKTYSEEFKAQIMAQMPPTNRGIPELARETARVQFGFFINYLNNIYYLTFVNRVYNEREGG